MEQFYFVLTEKCNLTCTHCIRNSSPLKDETSEIALVIEALNQIKRNFKDSTVLLSGGEPTIYKYFADILHHVIQLDLDVIINSNGTTSFFNIQQISQLLGSPRVSFQISLDGRKENHDSIRGTGAYDRSLKTISLLRQHNIKCSVSTTVLNDIFFKEVERFIHEIDELGLTHISIKRATYAGRASSGVDLSTEIWNENVYKLRALNTKTILSINPMYDFSKLDKIDDSNLAKIQPDPLSVNCGAGVAKVYIYASGDVCPCTCFKNLPMGNLHSDSLINILNNTPKFNVSEPTCKKCRYYSLCQGGCLGSGYQYTGVLGNPDPRCPKIAAEAPC